MLGKKLSVPSYKNHCANTKLQAFFIQHQCACACLLMKDYSRKDITVGDNKKLHNVFEPHECSMPTLLDLMTKKYPYKTC